MSVDIEIGLVVECQTCGSDLTADFATVIKSNGGTYHRLTVSPCVTCLSVERELANGNEERVK